MKKTILLFSAAALLLTACQDAPKADNAEATEAQEVTNEGGELYNADLTQSKVEWTGTKATGQHIGTINLTSGSLNVANNTITGGSFVLDVNSINPMDQDAEGNEKLKTHLLSPDFFDAANHPEASFEITGVTEGAQAAEGEEVLLEGATHTITGNLNMKGISKSISFPAKVTMGEGNVTADANFNFDRTQWNLNYGSDESLGDKFIHHAVNLKLHLVASK